MFGKITNKKIQYQIYAHIYLELLIVFPELNIFLHLYNQTFKVIRYIHSIDYKVQKSKFYQLYTNNFQSFAQMNCQDIITIYNFYFCLFLNNSKEFILFSNEFF